MHMADALISPAVGGTMWIVTAGLIAYCARKLKQTMKDNLVPMMGVMGAFIFAAQMINFSIPGTGSSGHLGGALILSALLGPYAAFLVMASVLTVQAFFFADGGLLALGCNIFNLGFYPAFIAYPFIYRLIVHNEYGTPRHVAHQTMGKWPLGRRRGAWIAAMIAAVVGLQLGAFSVVLETRASGISELPFGAFVLLMLPIHLAIGIVEGLATAAVVAFMAKARPELVHLLREDVSDGPVARHGVARLPHIQPSQPEALLRRSRPVRHYNKAYLSPVTEVWPVLTGLLIAAVIIGGAVSWFASTHPDGLEWSIAKVTGKAEVSGTEDNLHKGLGHLQEKTAFLPDYDFKLGRRGGDAAALPLARAARGLPESGNPVGSPRSLGEAGRARASLAEIPGRHEPLAELGQAGSGTGGQAGPAESESWPAINAGTSVSGIVGGLLTFTMACLAGFALKARRAAV